MTTPLNKVNKFKEFQVNQFIKHNNFSHQLLYRFENGYGASVIHHPGSYGYEEGLMELAVIIWNKDKWDLDYSTEITDDVIGNLSISKVEKLLEQIKNLKGETNDTSQK